MRVLGRIVPIIVLIVLFAATAVVWNVWRWERRAALDRAVIQAGFAHFSLAQARYRTPCPPGADAFVVDGGRSDGRLGEGYACLPTFDPPIVLVTEVDRDERLYLK